MNTKTAFAGVTLLFLLLAVPGIGRAAAGQAAPETSATVFVGGTEIMRVRVAGGGYTTAQRAQQIQERVNMILGRGTVRADDITVSAQGNQALVLVKGQLLLTADSATARFNRMTPRQLAGHWAERMRAILPTLTQPK